MSFEDPAVDVLCDGHGCRSKERVELTLLATSTWDDRDARNQLREWGWFVDGTKHFCPDCHDGEDYDWFLDDEDDDED